MNRLTVADLDYLYEQAVLGPLSRDEAFRDYFQSEWMATITDHFSRLTGAYHPMYPFLSALARKLQPGLIVELGVEIGRGMASMHFGCPEANIVGVDILDVTGPANSFKPYAVPGRWRIIWGDSLEFGREQPQAKIGLLHVDSDHLYATTLVEWQMYRPMMVSGGVMCFDDLDCEGVRRVWDEQVLDIDQKVEMPGLHSGMGNGCVICG